MDNNLKQQALRKLVNIAGDYAESVIQKECEKITSALQSETDYDKISDLLELLDTISGRVYEETIDAIRNLLKRLEGLELTYQEIPGFSFNNIRELHNNTKLMVKALEILGHIRYYEPLSVLDILFQYSYHEDTNVVKQAVQGIKRLAGYQLDIFYGDGKNLRGLGWGPQIKVLEKIRSYDAEQTKKCFTAVVIACDQMLQPAITGTEYTYKVVTWKNSAIPANEGMKDIRKQTLTELVKLYNLSTSVDQKKAVINAMQTATRTPSGSYGGDLLAMIIENTITVVEFMQTVATSEDMQILQKIEHDAYWLLKNRGGLNNNVHSKTLEIRDSLYGNEEYQKYRILIGFESIFHDWELDRNVREEIVNEKDYREKETIKLAESINDKNYSDWKERIIKYGSIKSSDYATFPYFIKFLNHFAKTAPKLALNLLRESSEQIENFIINILNGIVVTEYKDDVDVMINRWCDEDKYLYQLARYYEYSSEINEAILDKIFKKAKLLGDMNAICQVIYSVTAHYDEMNKNLIEKFFMPALEVLSDNKEARWINGFWFRKQERNIVEEMEPEQHKALLNNLYWLDEVDYHAEEVMYEIAKQAPELVIEYFLARISKGKNEEELSRINIIPFGFHLLSEPLSQNPENVLDMVLEKYDGNYGEFVLDGARLLKEIFPKFPPKFEQKLLEILKTTGENELLFVMGILGNYDGSPSIHNICKEIIKILPETSNLLNELISIMQKTGVVTGEYGFVDAYKIKIDQMQSWLQDDNVKIQSFATKYIENLEKQIQYEKKLADDNITLQKHKYDQ
jgi:hypothetical protein